MTKSSNRCTPRVAATERAASRTEVQLGESHLRGALVWLVGRPERIVAGRAVGHLDVAAEHVVDRVLLGEGHHPVECGAEGGEVGGMETTGQDGVAGEQDRGPRVVVGDGRSVVARGA